MTTHAANDPAGREQSALDFALPIARLRGDGNVGSQLGNNATYAEILG